MGVSFFASEAIAVAGVAIGATVATRGAATHGVFSVETAAVRYTLDGSAPTATLGNQLEVGDTLYLDSPDQVSRVKFIRRDGVSASVYASYGLA